MDNREDLADVVEIWTRFPELFWSRMFSVAKARPGREVFQQSLELSNELTEWMITLQADWTRLCLARLRAEVGDSQELLRFVEQVESLAEHYGQLQRSMWRAWVEAAGRSDWFRGSMELPSVPASLLEVWRNVFEKTGGIQRDWIRWMSGRVMPTSEGREGG